MTEGKPKPAEPKAAAKAKPAESKSSAQGKPKPAKAKAAAKAKPAKPKPARVGFGVPVLDDARAMERLYCSDRQLPSPMGGSLAYMGVRAEASHGSTVLFECTRSALRFELPMRGSSWRERRKVKDQVADGLEPLCPRAALGPALQRREDQWYCPRCNIKFGLIS